MIDWRGCISAPLVVADAACELLCVLAIWPCVGIARFLEESGVLGEAIGQGVEVFEESIDGVVPTTWGFTLCDRDDALRRKECAVWRREILVGEDEDGFAGPFASLGDTEEIEVAYS